MARRTTAASSVGATQTSEALIKNFLDVFWSQSYHDLHIDFWHLSRTTMIIYTWCFNLVGHPWQICAGQVLWEHPHQEWETARFDQWFAEKFQWWHGHQVMDLFLPRIHCHKRLSSSKKTECRPPCPSQVRDCAEEGSGDLGGALQHMLSSSCPWWDCGLQQGATWQEPMGSIHVFFRC